MSSLVSKIVNMGPTKAHKLYRKVITLPACPVDLETFKIWYTPGVAEPCREIMKDPKEVWNQTGRGNRVAIVSDGTRILGLRSEGVCGAEASLPVMEGKALLFRALGAVDGVPLVFGWKGKSKDDLHIPSDEKIISMVKWSQANFGGINLEDIEAKDDKCFKILDGLRDDPELNIPVWHDDQQGTATAVIAALINAVKLSGKDKKSLQFVCVGSGAAMLAIIRLLNSWGISHNQIRLLDSKGSVDEKRDDIPDGSSKGKLKSVVQQLNVLGDKESKEKAIKDADILVAASASVEGGIIDPELIKTMSSKPIVITMANPYPEIDPNEAKKNGAFIVGTGRSDFSNQVNNSLVFPGIFRGILDTRSSSITDDIAIAAANAIASRAREEKEFGFEAILPKMDDMQMVVDIATAVAMRASKDNLAVNVVNEKNEDEYRKNVKDKLVSVRKMIENVVSEL